MATWLERYRAGEHRRVWLEMTALEEAIRPKIAAPIPSQLAWKDVLREARDDRYVVRYADAVAVARETMQRARQNVEMLVARLRILGYQFEEPDRVFVPPPPDASEQLRAFEQLAGSFPLSVRAWCEQVGTIYLRGEHPRLTEYRSEWSWQNCTFPDPLEFDAPFDYLGSEYDEWSSCQEQGYIFPFGIEFAGDDYHKANVSGGPPYKIVLPNAAADAPIRYTPYGEIMFVDYLRLAFQWGGFPGFSRYPDYPEEEITFFTDGLLPL